MIASDWDGYRDLQRNGIDGFLVPTHWAMRPNTHWFVLGPLGVIPYPAFAGALAQLVQVDMDAAESAISFYYETIYQGVILVKLPPKEPKNALNAQLSISLTKTYSILQEEAACASDRVDAFSLSPSWQAHDPVRLFGGFSNGKADPSSQASCLQWL